MPTKEEKLSKLCAILERELKDAIKAYEDTIKDQPESSNSQELGDRAKAAMNDVKVLESTLADQARELWKVRMAPLFRKYNNALKKIRAKDARLNPEQREMLESKKGFMTALQLLQKGTEKPATGEEASDKKIDKRRLNLLDSWLSSYNDFEAEAKNLMDKVIEIAKTL